MKVDDLIHELKSLPQDWNVMIWVPAVCEGGGWSAEMKSEYLEKEDDEVWINLEDV